MTKADIVNEISKTTGIEKAAVLATIESFMETVKESLSHGENVYLRGFGGFIVKQNTTIVIPEHKIPAFKPARTFMDDLKDLK